MDHAALLPLSNPTNNPLHVRTPGTTGYFEQWGLAVAAVSCWVLTIFGLAIATLTTSHEGVHIGLFVGAYLAGGTIAARTAFTDLRSRQVNVDLLMVTAAVGAATIGAWAEGALLLALFSTSNALEHHALERTRNAVRALMELTPATATRLRNEAQEVTPVEDLLIGDLILIRPGEKVPTDAEIVEGTSALDQAALTGESLPVTKSPGDSIFAATINGHGALRARVTSLANQSMLAKIVKLVEEAQAQKSNAERFSDKFEGRYAVGIMVFSALVAIVPILFGEHPGIAFYRAMTLLVVASPCALVISTPAATLSALANAARNGVLVKGGSHLELLGTVDTVAFDKTGTLTSGRPQLTDVYVSSDRISEDELIQLVASAEQLSEHPLANALILGASARGIPLHPASDLLAISGGGIRATVNGRAIAVGNERLLAAQNVVPSFSERDVLATLRSQGKTAMLASDDRGVLGIVAVADLIRPEARTIVQHLKRIGVTRTVMLTGDSEAVAQVIAREVGIDEVRSELLPADKLEVIRALQASGKVAMVGDGVNDAPALAMANIGIAMGGVGTDVALETADVVLMSDDLGRVPFAIELSRRMRRTIRVNIVFALSVILLLVLSTLSIGIPLPLGVVGHEGSTIIVVLISLRLLANAHQPRAGIASTVPYQPDSGRGDRGSDQSEWASSARRPQGSPAHDEILAESMVSYVRK